ncbi:MAG: hypothetical protein L0G60_14095 [Acinetobacter sp.]|nr:hypothetical protein [Acinetobacter sp.]
MKKILLFIGLTLTFAADAKQATQSDEAIKKEIIQQSIQTYSGNCPYNTARNGSRCGKRSAYNRVGGAAPLCYSEDVSDRMVKEFKGRA